MLEHLGRAKLFRDIWVNLTVNIKNDNKLRLSNAVILFYTVSLIWLLIW